MSPAKIRHPRSMLRRAGGTCSNKPRDFSVKEKDRRSKNASVTTAKGRGAEARGGGRHDQKRPVPPKGSGFKERPPRPAVVQGAAETREKSAKHAPAQEAPARVIARRTGDKPAERVPLILETVGASGYHLIDSGAGEKLEQYGPYRIVRPEAQALWPRSLPDHIWEKADAIFTGDTDEDGMGRWRFPGAVLGETWPMKHDGIHYLGRFTSFRHVGVFPEQASHWNHMAGLIEKAKRPVKVLNLFGYTGLASLVAARAGAEVTLTRVDTGESRKTLANNEGIYSFPLIEPGNYRIDVKMTGFKSTTVQNIVVQYQQRARVNVTMEVGQLTQVVEVQAEARLLNTEDAAVVTIQASQSLTGTASVSKTLENIDTDDEGVFNQLSIPAGGQAGSAPCGATSATVSVQLRATIGGTGRASVEFNYINGVTPWRRCQ